MNNATALTELTLSAPLGVDWTPQLVRLTLPGVEVGQPVTLRLDGQPIDFQFIGQHAPEGAQVAFYLGFEAHQQRTVSVEVGGACDTDLTRRPIALDRPTPLGVAGREVTVVPPTERGEAAHAGPFGAIGSFPLESQFNGRGKLAACELAEVATGPLYIEYELAYRFKPHGHYTLTLRCHRRQPLVEVHERINLGMDSKLTLSLNPAGRFDQILSHRNFDFEQDGQPTLHPLDEKRPKDVLCRLQAPVLGEYIVPNNRGWFALLNEADADQPMLGVMAIEPARWRRPVENMVQLLGRGGRTQMHASLNGGERYWAFYVGPVEKDCTTTRRFVFHRLQAEHHALRLDEHFDCTAGEIYDRSCHDQPAVLCAGYREKAQHNAAALDSVRRAIEHLGEEQPVAKLGLDGLLHGRPADHQAMLDDMLGRFDKWVRQFQGYREGAHDYAKNVIGFSRRLRGLLIRYELLRKDGALGDGQAAQLHSYFIFAARRILDEGRWPHSKTWLHPDHPDSARDFYTYPGEHKPDRVVWTNSLPNFQSDPICCLAHLGCLIPDHPDAERWRRFAIEDIERQLDGYMGQSGAWEESINYALYTLSYLVITFKALKHRAGIDYFNDARVRRLVGWLVRFLAPMDKRWGVHTWPAVGNAVLPQVGADILLAYAGELDPDDPLRHDCFAVYQACEPAIKLREHYPMMTALADAPDRDYPLPVCESEHMDELGVSMRHHSTKADESYLFQKIGFWKDHYENDETSFNWYAKGTPLCMDYGTYSRDASTAGAHNLVELPDMDSLRRGYLAEHFLSGRVDYTRCEVPITLKLDHGHLRTFEEIDGPPQPPLYNYIGDENPVGPRTWKTRQLLFIKPDYLVTFDRIHGAVPHRYNLHAVADEMTCDGQTLRARGRFDLDLLGFVQHPARFKFENGKLIPAPEKCGQGEDNPHRQAFGRIYNEQDNVYRTLLFAQERGRNVSIEPLGESGIKVSTPEYTDCVFLSDRDVEASAQGAAFYGRAGWIRRWADGRIEAAITDGQLIEAFGRRFHGRGPWLHANGQTRVDGVPRRVDITSTG